MSESLKNFTDWLPVVFSGLGMYLLCWPRQIVQKRMRAGGEKFLADVQKNYANWSLAAGKPLSLSQFVAFSLVCAFGAGSVLLLLTKLVMFAILAAVVAAGFPYLSINAKLRKLQEARSKAWPHLVDNLVSGVRAGMSLGETLTKVSTSVPAALQIPFEHFAFDYRAAGNLDASLAQLKQELADPIADRIIEALRLAAQVGGNDLVALLEDLGAMIRAEERTRAEILARQSWTVTGARLATAAPWLILLMLLPNGQTLQVYSTPTGGTILLAGATVSAVAYLLMIRLGRLDRPPRMMSN